METENQKDLKSFNNQREQLEKVMGDSIHLLKNVVDAHSRSSFRMNHILSEKGNELAGNIKSFTSDLMCGDQNDSLINTKNCILELAKKSDDYLKSFKYSGEFCNRHNTNEYIRTECPKNHNVCMDCQLSYAMQCTNLAEFIKTNAIPSNFCLPVCVKCLEDNMYYPLPYSVCAIVFMKNISHYFQLIEKIRAKKDHDLCMLCSKSGQSVPLHDKKASDYREIHRDQTLQKGGDKKDAKVKETCNHSLCPFCFEKYSRSLYNENYLVLKSGNGKANGWEQVSSDPFKSYKCIFPFCNLPIDTDIIGKLLSKIIGNKNEILDYMKKIEIKPHHAEEAFRDTYLAYIG